VYGKTESGTAGLLAVNPKDGSFLWGGDRNTSTGREPWRQPYMHWLTPDGRDTKASLWGWDPKRVGSNDYRLVSDSSPRNALFTPQGDLLVCGWSDGGNSVFNRQPTDLDREAPGNASSFSTWGMKQANSLGWLMLIDADKLTVQRKTQFVSYVPDSFASKRDRGAPNFATIEQITLLGDQHIGFCGGAATGLIQTPGAFYKHPDDGRKAGGKYAAVYTNDMTQLLFSSYLPGYKHVTVGPAGQGMAVAGMTTGDDGSEHPDTGKPTPTPTLRAIDDTLGGAYDAHIILLGAP